MLAVGVVLALTVCHCRSRASRPGPPYRILQAVSGDLLRQANHGRDVLGADGFFRFPWWVKTVWVDVGAHHLETTRDPFLTRRTLGLIAVEPMRQCWPTWPDSRRLIGIPAAIFLERGTMDFHVNASDDTSSLASSVTGTALDRLTRTVEVRKVPVLRLEDVLAAIPLDIAIDYLKTDVQSMDLQVLQSAGDQLRRVRRVRAEVINSPLYHSVAGHQTATEKEMEAFMATMGFRFVADDLVAGNRAWLDKQFINTQMENAPAH
jgi:FkbM family methyltransferase